VADSASNVDEGVQGYGQVRALNAGSVGRRTICPAL